MQHDLENQREATVKASEVLAEYVPPEHAETCDLLAELIVKALMYHADMNGPAPSAGPRLDDDKESADMRFGRADGAMPNPNAKGGWT